MASIERDHSHGAIQPDKIAGALYYRKYRILVIGPTGTTLFDSLPGATGKNAIDLSDLHCIFSFEKKYQQNQQFGEVTVFNLNATTETAIFKACINQSVTVRIEAGYRDGPYGLIFQGRVFQPIRGKSDETSYFLKLVCLDGDDALNLGFANFTIYAGYDGQKIIDEVCRKSNIPFKPVVNAQLSKQKGQRGKTVFGNVGRYVRSVAINNNAGIYFDNGVGYISGLAINANLTKDSPDVVKLNYQTGMIGMPKQIDSGVQVKSLINPGIQMLKWVYLNNSDINLNQVQLGQLQTMLDLDGFYRVVGIKCTGDTRGTDWYYDLDTVSQKGKLPDMLINNNATGF